MSEEQNLNAAYGDIDENAEAVDPTDSVRAEESQLFIFKNLGTQAGTTTAAAFQLVGGTTAYKVFDKSGGYYNVVVVYANTGANAAQGKVQGSIDKVTWFDVGTPKTAIAAGSGAKDEFATDLPFLRALVASETTTAATAVNVKVLSKYYK